MSVYTSRFSNFVLKYCLTKYDKYQEYIFLCNIHPPEVVGRGGETQLQVGGNLN